MLSKSPYVISGYVWLFSGLCLLIYASVGLFGYQIPGVEQATSFLSGVEGYYIYLSAFIVIFIEGIYLIGNFFPGSTALIIIALGAQIQSTYAFISTIIAIFTGWCLAGGINVLLGKVFHNKFSSNTNDPMHEPTVNSQKLITWFPAFRSNYEVAQIIEGNSIYMVLLSSFKIKLITSFVMMLILYILSLFVDVSSVKNEEGFVTLIVLSLICFLVGINTIKKGI